MIVGEGPGPEEDISGIPFDPNAPAGELLTQVLAELGVSRRQVYITNATRCKKEFTWDKKTEITPAHIRACKHYLVDEIEKVNPKYIVLAGNEALKSCLGHAGITKAHGILQKGPDGRMYMPIIHPAAALNSRTPEHRNRVKEALMDLIGRIKNEAMDPLNGVTCNVVFDFAGFKRLKSELEALYQINDRTTVCIDLETNSLRNAFINPNARVGGVAFAWKENEGWYLPVDHENPVVWNNEQRAEVIKFLTWFAKSKFRKTNQNIKFDYNHWRGAFHTRLRYISGDSMLASHLVDQNTSHGLDKIAWRVGLGGYDQPLEDWFAKNKIKERNYLQVPLDILGKYGCGDVVCSLRGENYFLETIKKRKQLPLYKKHVVPGIVPYADMEAKGMLLDLEYLDKVDVYYKEKTVEKRMEMRKIAGQRRLQATLDDIAARANKKGRAFVEFNFDSNEQTGRMLDTWLDASGILDKIDKREMDQKKGTQRRMTDWEMSNSDLRAAEVNPRASVEITKSGRLSVSKGTLQAILGNKRDFKLSDDQRLFIDTLLEYKGYQKILSTSIKGIRKHIGPDSRVRTTYVLHGAATGRRSSNKPNLQNIPRISTVKRMFVAPDKYLLLIFDYKNLEVRIAAAMSEDKKLLDAFNSGKDVHTYVASAIYKEPYDKMMTCLNTPYEVVKKDETLNERYVHYTTLRARAKLVVWTVLFGGGATKISNLTGITLGEADATLKSMLKEFNGLQSMFEEFEDFATEHKYAQTDFNRRRYLLGIGSSNTKQLRDAIREALNSPIQGTAAGITYEAMTRTHKKLREDKLRAYIIQEVHDALTIEVHYKDAYKAAGIALDSMSSVVTPRSEGRIVFEADGKIGKHLGSKTALDTHMMERLNNIPKEVYDLCCRDITLNPEDYEDRKQHTGVMEVDEEGFDSL